jgi:hypothetical protein
VGAGDTGGTSLFFFDEWKLGNGPSVPAFPRPETEASRHAPDRVSILREVDHNCFHLYRKNAPWA